MNETIAGKVVKFDERQEQDKEKPLETAVRMVQIVTPDLTREWGKRKVRVKRVWNIVLQRKQGDTSEPSYLTVEMSGRKCRGFVRVGEDVEVTGRFNRDGIFVGKFMVSLLTGEKIYCK